MIFLDLDKRSGKSSVGTQTVVMIWGPRTMCVVPKEKFQAGNN